MFLMHYPALCGAYLVALVGWIVANQLAPDTWPASAEVAFTRPWRELGIALVAVVGLVLVGQLYTHGIRIPEVGALKTVCASINQIIIYAPVLLLLPLRRQPWSTAWLSKQKFGQRLFLGLVLAVLAVVTYSLLRKGAGYPWGILNRIASYRNLDKFVQVFLEDVAIAILFVRFKAAVGAKWAVLSVAALFVAGHIPAMISNGASQKEFARLIADVGLVSAIMLVWGKSRDVVWFCLVHFCLDMCQFDAIVFGR